MKRFLINGLAWVVITNAALLVGPDGVDGATRRRDAAAQAARAGREFKVRAGHVVTLAGENLRIRFASVAEDSRCPAGVNCVWAGNAEVLIEVGAKGVRGKKVLRLSTSAVGRGVVEGKYLRYTVKLVGLSPQPREGRKIPAGEYTATLLVVKD
jgi:hypothetical protein